MAKKLFTSETAPRQGRAKGAKNRSTEEIRNFIQKVVDNNLDQLEGDLMEMNATNRWIILDKLTKYFLPSLTKNDNKNTIDGGITIKVVYDDDISPTPVLIQGEGFTHDGLYFKSPDQLEMGEEPF